MCKVQIVGVGVVGFAWDVDVEAVSHLAYFSVCPAVKAFGAHHYG